jgi:hypothetical protein
MSSRGSKRIHFQFPRAVKQYLDQQTRQVTLYSCILQSTAIPNIPENALFGMAAASF